MTAGKVRVNDDRCMTKFAFREVVASRSSLSAKTIEVLFEADRRHRSSRPEAAAGSTQSMMIAGYLCERMRLSPAPARSVDVGCHFTRLTAAERLAVTLASGL